MKNINLRKTQISDLETLFKFQTDEKANYLAAFTSKDPSNKKAYINKWTKILDDPTVHIRTIYLSENIAGSIGKYEINSESEITYWIGKDFWGKGIATEALKRFLKLETRRPIKARTAYDNFGSQKVLQKNGFVKIGIEKGFSNFRNKDIEEFIYELK